MASTPIRRPAPQEHAPYYSRYIDLVEGDDVLPQSIAQIDETARRLGGLGESRAMHRYAPGKWSVKQVVGHLSDTERVFAYRALRIGRADATPLAGFDENYFVDQGAFDERPLDDLVLEYRAVRSASIALFASMPEEALVRLGLANEQPISPRALAWIIAGHELHHRAILAQRYGIV